MPQSLRVLLSAFVKKESYSSIFDLLYIGTIYRIFLLDAALLRFAKLGIPNRKKGKIHFAGYFRKKHHFACFFQIEKFQKIKITLYVFFRQVRLLCMFDFNYGYFVCFLHKKLYSN